MEGLPGLVGTDQGRPKNDCKMSAAEEDQVEMMKAKLKIKFPNTPEGARRYIQSKDTESQTCDCADCGNRIPMIGATCFEFGI